MEGNSESQSDSVEKLLSRPRSQVSVVFRQEETEVILLQGEKVFARCPLDQKGMQAAFFMAKALGIKVPPQGEEAQTQVSTGVLWRAISISSLDFRKPESFTLLERLLEESEMMRNSTFSG